MTTKQNANAIKAHTNQLKNLTANVKSHDSTLQQGIKQGNQILASRINELTSKTETMQQNVTQNTKNVDKNTTDIRILGELVEKNIGSIYNNKTDIDEIGSNLNKLDDTVKQNTQNIASNSTKVNQNSAAIKQNSTDIASNSTKVNQNTTAIKQNSEAIVQATKDLGTLIKTVEKDLGKLIEDVAKSVDELSNAVELNAASITENQTQIQQTRLDVNAISTNPGTVLNLQSSDSLPVPATDGEIRRIEGDVFYYYTDKWYKFTSTAVTPPPPLGLQLSSGTVRTSVQLIDTLGNPTSLALGSLTITEAAGIDIDSSGNPVLDPSGNPVAVYFEFSPPVSATPSGSGNYEFDVPYLETAASSARVDTTYKVQLDDFLEYFVSFTFKASTDIPISPDPPVPMPRMVDAPLTPADSLLMANWGNTPEDLDLLIDDSSGSTVANYVLAPNNLVGTGVVVPNLVISNSGVTYTFDGSILTLDITDARDASGVLINTQLSDYESVGTAVAVYSPDSSGALAATYLTTEIDVPRNTIKLGYKGSVAWKLSGSCNIALSYPLTVNGTTVLVDDTDGNGPESTVLRPTTLKDKGSKYHVWVHNYTGSVSANPFFGGETLFVNDSFKTVSYTNPPPLDPDNDVWFYAGYYVAEGDMTTATGTFTYVGIYTTTKTVPPAYL